MVKVYRNYRKDEIAARMLDTALDLFFKDGDGFSIIHLAAAAEEVLAGLIKHKATKAYSSPVQTAREKTISALKEIHAIHGTNRTEKEIGTYLNSVRNKTKHHDPESDPVEFSACLELEVEGAVFHAIENYILCFGNPTDKIIRYINLQHGQKELRKPPNGSGQVQRLI
ncbi:MAG: hypothetical protein KGJ87_11395 [Planctomycetota bacterium]|nr:hypothetical protein [Planctomycetota bacterium]MDE1889565.1 hypothetical protein [Planctomycetota bacterium]MDE2217745.1 hypothetical protein [Planctomycetota bacterium]